MNLEKNNYLFSICLYPYVGIMDIGRFTRKIKNCFYSKREHLGILEVNTHRCKNRGYGCSKC